jgi:hypothetical protein
LVDWQSGKLSAGTGPRYDQTHRGWRAIYEVRLDQSVAGKDLYLMVRGPGATASVGATIGF